MGCSGTDQRMPADLFDQSRAGLDRVREGPLLRHGRIFPLGAGSEGQFIHILERKFERAFRIDRKEIVVIQ